MTSRHTPRFVALHVPNPTAGSASAADETGAADQSAAGPGEPAIEVFPASDGYGLHYRHWAPSGPRPAGYVVALHGIQSHSGWYGYSSGRLRDAGWDVRFLDRRGSGRNEFERGHVDHEDRLVNDVVQFLGEVRAERNRVAPTVPIVLLSVSWGGKLAAVTAARRPELVDGTALLYPGIFAQIGRSPWQRFLLQLAWMLGARRRRVPLPLGDPALFTADPQWQAFLREDPLSLHEATVSFLHASRRLDLLAEESAPRLHGPLLLMFAGGDRITDNDATRRWFGEIASGTKTLKEYPAAAHTLEFEPDRYQFVDDLLAWLESVRATC